MAWLLVRQAQDSEVLLPRLYVPVKTAPSETHHLDHVVNVDGFGYRGLCHVGAPAGLALHRALPGRSMAGAGQDVLGIPKQSGTVAVRRNSLGLLLTTIHLRCQR